MIYNRNSKHFIYFMVVVAFGKQSANLLTLFGFTMQAFIKIILLSLCFVPLVSADNELVLAALSLDQATKNVIEAKKSKVLGAKTEMIAGKEIHVIKILTKDGHVQYLKVDAESGKIIK